MELGVDTCRLIDFPVVASRQLPQPFREWLGEANDQMLFFNLYRKKLQASTGRFWTRTTPFWRWESFMGVPTSPDVTCGTAILIPRWRRRKWRQPRPRVAFSTPIVEVEENGGPSASVRHLGWPHFRVPEMRSSKMAAESGRAAIFLHLHNGVEKAALYYYCRLHWNCHTNIFIINYLIPYKKKIILRISLQVTTFPTISDAQKLLHG